LKRLFLISLFLSFSISSGQQEQGSNIDLDEVINTAGAIPRIYLDGVGYSFRERDTLVKKLFRSAFWKTFEFIIDLEEYETGKKFSFESKGPIKVFINNVELNKNHNFKTFTNIRKLTQKIERTEIRTDQEKKQVVTSRQVKPMIMLNGVGSIEGTTEYSRKEVPVSHIKITANLDPDTVYNRPTYKSKVRQIESEQASSIALEGVEVVKSITKDGIVYSPIYVDGKLTFKEDDKLTVLARDAKKYKGMGLNEWGIDVNTDSWGVALRAHYKGPMTPDGLPILVPALSINNLAMPLWVIDGTALTEAPKAVRSLTPLIREVKMLKYSETSFYGARGAAGVIVINTATGLKDGQNAKRSFNVKGKKNRQLMTEYQKFETQFKVRLEQLKNERKFAYENDNIIRIDSFQQLLDKTLLKSYLYTANFALRNSDYEISPYLAFTKISDANISLLNSIEEKLSPKVKKSRYGKKFIAFLKSRKENRLNDSN